MACSLQLFLVNASRSIIYASSGKDLTTVAAKEARSMAEEMSRYLDAVIK